MSGEKLPDINSNANLLNKWGILALGVGGCIGSGVISLLGYGIGRTGHSVWLAFAIALLMGFIICIPVLFVTGSVCLPGGTYSLITAILGKKVAGVYIITFFLNLPGIALYRSFRASILKPGQTANGVESSLRGYFTFLS